MEIYKAESKIGRQGPWYLGLLSLFLIGFGVVVVMNGIAVLLVSLLFGFESAELQEFASDPASSTLPHARIVFLLMQGIASGLAFALAALIYARFIDNASFGWKHQNQRFRFDFAVYVVALSVLAITANAYFIQWNSQLTLPESWAALEEALKSQEERLEELTLFLLDFQHIGEFLLGFLVVAVGAGIGEELFFRGVLQPKLQRYTGNPHVAIWVTAFIFSAIHFQFYGLIPRTFLGAFFGYLYYYTGSLWYPALAHTFNNGLTILMVYLHRQELVETDIQDPSLVAPLLSLGAGGLLVLGLGLLRKMNKKRHELEKSI
ncbi:abortive infection protein [Nitritalea halalkaliphila LW7]|uniref:Abortive infection protein n=1 Tax=Nitritalea halalkaliphila LW7 TaxID=1189621 RepID=I5CAA0_9BACT|nr:CPBP family intramembrane glutamic endopeptidase [Nitritalea halalkaliphila]EIM78752.1 abortive infection protein [Nitritalea halalkaliphila LW7]